MLPVLLEETTTLMILGRAADSPEDVIVSIARRLDEGNFPLTQIGIQFVQVGTSSDARDYLQRLDDTLVSTYKIRVRSPLLPPCICILHCADVTNRSGYRGYDTL